jgi:hypothetical protein
MADNIRGQRPARTSPSRLRNGRSEGGTDPTNETGQTPSDIFGISQSYSTGARGSRGASGGNADVTIEAGQLEGTLSNISGSEITSTGAPGSTGASRSGGGDTVTYTNPFAQVGSSADAATTTRGHIHGSGDWSQANSDGYDGGPTLPILQNARPTSTGAGQGHVRGAGKGL